ncbi:MAG: shikimate dehydrogenase [Candidatus Omnitrophota bacterium]
MKNQKINGKTEIYGLIGWPVEHSFSPAMHNAAFKALGIKALYKLFPVEEKNFDMTLKELVASGIKGFNVTIPYKEKIIPYLSSLQDELTKLIRAVNTVVVKNGELIGCNTDWIGFTLSLQTTKIENKKVFILGAGGAAKAVAVALAYSKADNIYVTDLAKEKAESLVAHMNKHFKKSKAEYVSDLKSKEAQEKLKEADLVINATGIGLREDDPALVKPEWVREGQIAYDLIYNPPLTNFLKVYSENGAKKILNGRKMLLYQAVEAFKLFTGKQAPIKVMDEALERELYG